MVSGWTAIIHDLRREGRAAQAHAEAAIAACLEQEYALYIGAGTLTRGWALAEQGQLEEGIAQMRQGLAAWSAETGQTFWPALLAAAYGRAGQTEEGLSILAEALAVTNKTGERFYEAEVYRLKGILTLQSKVQGPKPVLSLVEGSKVEEEAEECFKKAIEIACKQQAKALELRAATSLARLWQQQGKQKEAHEMLAAVYNWFTEGFDTKDLQEARALLDELSERG
jgi:predicted ATPase